MEESPLEHLALKAMPSYLKSNLKAVHSGNSTFKRLDFVIQCHSFLVTPLKHKWPSPTFGKSGVGSGSRNYSMFPRSIDVAGLGTTAINYYVSVSDSVPVKARN